MKKELIKKYMDGEIGVTGMHYNRGDVKIIEIVYDIEDKVFGLIQEPNKEKFFLTKVYYGNRDYIMLEGARFYMDEFFRVSKVKKIPDFDTALFFYVKDNEHLTQFVDREEFATTREDFTKDDNIDFFNYAFLHQKGDFLVTDLQVLRSNAGYYIGTSYWSEQCQCLMPYHRESQEYYKTEVEAAKALENKSYKVRYYA